MYAMQGTLTWRRFHLRDETTDEESDGRIE